LSKRQARQVAEFQTVRPTPAPDEVIEGQIVMTKQWDLSKIQDDQSPDPTEPPGRPAPVPVCSSPGEVIGTATVGAAPLVTTTGSWTNSPSSYGYAWKRNGLSIPGASNQIYVLVADWRVRRLRRCGRGSA
jgi:hypothetical protein